jgi:uncharacterized delta-60 repeat protein
MMKKLLPLTLIVFAALPGAAMSLTPASPPAKLQRHPGQLDRSFSRDGKAIVKLGPEVGGSPAHFAKAGDGRIVAAVDAQLVELTSTGRIHQSFGRNGRVTIPQLRDRSLSLAGLAVDSRGRILIAGTARRQEHSALTYVFRYLPNGSLDPGFGSGGTVLTDLGLPAPPPPPNRGLMPDPPLTEPIVEAFELALDGADRPLLSGSWLSGWQFCYPYTGDTRKYSGYVARLTANGSLDTSFADAGVAVPHPAKEVDLSLIADGSGVNVVGKERECLRGSPAELELARLDQSGRLEQDFGSAGLVSLGSAEESPVMGRDRFGHIFLLGGKVLEQRSPRGFVDARFGNQGRTVILPATENLQALTVDRRGRPIVTGTPYSRTNAFAVARRTRSGDRDQSFGSDGRTFTAFKGAASAQGVLVVEENKILVGGTLRRQGTEYLALVRYQG